MSEHIAYPDELLHEEKLRKFYEGVSYLGFSHTGLLALPLY